MLKEEKYDQIVEIVEKAKKKIEKQEEKLREDLKQSSKDRGELGMRFNDAVSSIMTDAYSNIETIVSRL